MRRRRVAADQTGNVVAVSDDFPVDQVIDEPVEPDVVDVEPVDVENRDEPARWELPGTTGVQAVDDALAPLVELDDLPTGEHVAYYETVHRRLQDALADLDSA